MRTALGLLRFVGCWVTAIVFAGLELLVIALRLGDRVFHAVARGWAHTTLRLSGVNVRVKGLENVDFTRNYVYVSNHASMFDIPAIVSAIPDQIRIVYKKELHWIPIFGWGLKFGSYIAIDRSSGAEAMKSLEEASKKIRDGASVLLYAEGTRTQDGKLRPFKRGAFNLAVRAGIPIVPLTVNGSFGILRKSSFVIRSGTVELTLGSPITIHGSGKEEEMRVMALVHDAIRKHYVNQQ